MSTRETSLAAYKALVESGALLGKQADILKLVIERGPAIASVIVKGTAYARNLNCTRARFTELLARGLIREVGQQRDPATGRESLVWAFTGRTTPLEAPRKRPRGAKAWKGIARDLAEVVGVLDTTQPAYKVFVEMYGGEP